MSKSLQLVTGFHLALSRSHARQWKRILETGVYRCVRHLAAGEAINSSHLSRILRLTLLAPDIVEVILDAQQLKRLKLAELLRGIPAAWEEQRRIWS